MTTSDTISVAFALDPSVGDLGDGILEIEGLLHYDGETLQLEYRTTQMSLKQTPVKTVTLDASRITAMTYKGGLFWAKLTLFSNRLGTFEGVPGEHSDRLVLPIKRQSRAAAHNLASLFEINRLPPPPPSTLPRQ